MSEPRAPRAELWLERLGSSIVPLDDADVARGRRARTIARIDATLAGAGRRRGSRRWLAIAAAAAAMLLVGGVALLQFRGAASVARVDATRGDVLLTRAGKVTELRGQAALVQADRIRTTLGSAAIVLTSQARVEVGEHTSLRWPHADRTSHEELVLERGRVALSVPKLAPGQRLVVSTPDSTVVVKGTRFSVTYVAAPPHTEVRVEQGSVGVSAHGRHATLHAGDRWSSDAAASDDPAPASPAAGAPEARPSTSEIRSDPSVRLEVAAPPASSQPKVTVAAESPATTTLGEENRLYQEAMAAVARGQDAAAVGHLDVLLSRFPRSPLNEPAQVERFRALHRLGNGAAAARAARRYLGSYPGGFAGAEARRLSLGDVGPP